MSALIECPHCRTSHPVMGRSAMPHGVGGHLLIPVVGAGWDLIDVANELADDKPWVHTIAMGLIDEYTPLIQVARRAR